MSDASASVEAASDLKPVYVVVIQQPRDWASPAPALKTLPFYVVGGFATGTVLNDACAALWFSYLLIFLERIQGLSGTQAAFVFLAGQLADAFSTPIVGTLSDRSLGCAPLGLGRRHAFHLLGTTIVACSFTFVFAFCFPCLLAPGGPSSVTTAERTAGFSVAAAVFNLGWAASQVSHMSLALDLSPHEDERLTLYSARYCVFVFANLYIFASATGILSAIPDGENNGVTYLYLTICALGAGLFAALIFQLTTRGAVPRSSAPALRGSVEAAAAVGDSEAGGTPKKGTVVKTLASVALVGKSPRDWLVTFNFWKVAFAYMAMRLSITISGVYISFYLTDTLFMSQFTIGLVPLVQFVASLGAAGALKFVAGALGKRVTLTLGALCIILACIGMAFATPATSDVMYAIAILLGVGGATCTVSVLTLQSDLLGDDTKSAAFVIGVCSFCDKLAAGVVVLGLQIASDAIPPAGQGLFFRIVLGTVPAAAIAVCVACAWAVPTRNAALGAGTGEDAKAAPLALELTPVSSPVAQLQKEGTKGAPRTVPNPLAAALDAAAHATPLPGGTT